MKKHLDLGDTIVFYTREWDRTSTVPALKIRPVTGIETDSVTVPEALSVNGLARIIVSRHGPNFAVEYAYEYKHLNGGSISLEVTRLEKEDSHQDLSGESFIEE